MPRDNRCMYMAHVCCIVAVVKDSVFSIGVYCVFCVYCDAWSCRCSCMGSMSVCHVDLLCASCDSSQCCMTCSLLMLVKDARGDHMEEANSRASLMTAISVSFCLSHPVAVSALIICNGLCACTE